MKWDEYRPGNTRLSELVPDDEPVSVVGVMKQQGLFVFAVPLRYMTQGREVAFHCIGGKPQRGESYSAALVREAREEVGTHVEVSSASETQYLTSYADQGMVHLDDPVRPSVIYKRIRPNDPNVEDEATLWLLGYDVTLRDDAPKMRPSAEVGAILYLTEDMLRA
ncbi:MAG: NUDIX domain-containing protein, partial [Cryobacterium sp.]|nr:NUDIX domain-containing protein [Cryobacterium sp.]